VKEGSYGYAVVWGDIEAEEADGGGDLGDAGDCEGVEGLMGSGQGGGRWD
jgi:hypothetical protein